MSAVVDVSVAAALLVEGVHQLLWWLLICCLPGEERQRGSRKGSGTISLPSTPPSVLSIFIPSLSLLHISSSVYCSNPPLPRLLKLHPVRWMTVPSWEGMFQGQRCVVNMVRLAAAQAFLRMRQGTGTKTQSPYTTHDKKHKDSSQCLTLCVDMFRHVVV